MEVLVRNEGHPGVEYDSIRRLIRLVKVENERVCVVANPITSSVPEVIVTKKSWCIGRMKIAWVDSSMIVEFNERMKLFESLSFTISVLDSNMVLVYLTLASITNEVKGLFTLVSTTSDQARLASDDPMSLLIN